MPKTLERWSPMACLPVANLTPSGLLEMDVQDGEVELMRCNDMELRSNMTDPMVPIVASAGGKSSYASAIAGKEWIDRDKELKVSLTTHRLVFFQDTTGHNKRNVRFLHLSNVHHIETAGGGSGMLAFSSPKLSIGSYLGDILLVFRASGASKDRDDLLKFLQKALERKAWEIQSRLHEKKTASQAIAARKVGVDAIMSKSTLRHKEAAQLTETAFQGDAEDLLKEAAELVKVIQKYVSTLEKKEASGQDAKDAVQLSGMLENMGMASALSRQDFRGGGTSDYDEYTTTLARQLADFLRPKLPTVGGLLTLTDVYCLYNRARGTNLISPEDLMDAVGCMESLKLGMSERTFASGVKVIQDDKFSDKAMSVRLKELAEEQLTLNPTSGLTAMDASRALHISALLAHEQILVSEQLGFLCRDETLETTRFFPNLFDDFVNSI